MDRSAIEGISERLASLDGLYLPGAMHRAAPDPAQRKSALLELLSRDAPIFLERYGAELTSDELCEFENLREDYEVEWHLDRLRRRRNPTVEDDRTRSVTVKNRRRAYMDRLVKAGDYFSEDAMREREPYLHHEYLGKFQDPAGRGLSRPGERWSETLMRRCEEATLVERIRGEQQRLGIDRREWVGGGVEVEEYEGEEDEKDDEEEYEEYEKEVMEGYRFGEIGEGKSKSIPSKENGNYDEMIVEEENIPEAEKGKSKSPKKNDEQDAANDISVTPSWVAMPFEQTLSAEEMQDQLDQFTRMMQQKFLAGEDADYLDYSLVDNDERLDDHWLREANYDAEEKYFEED